MPLTAAYPRRVLIVTQYFWPEPGAPSVRYAAIVRTLRELGVSVDVLTGVPNYPTGRVLPGYRRLGFQVEEHDGAHIHRSPLFPYGGRNRWLRLLNHGSLAASATLAAIRGRAIDLVLAETPPLPLAVTAAAIARRNGVPLVVYVADLWPDVALAMGALREGWLADRLRSLEAFVYRNAARITVPTEGLFAALTAHPAAGPGKVLLLPNGVDPDVFHPIPAADCEVERTALGLAGRALFLYAGTIGHAQALDTIVDTAVALRDRSDIVFAFLGDGPERGRLEGRTRALRLDNVVFAGAVPPEHVARYLSLARATIAPLRAVDLFAATRPAKILPSLACARPVIFCGRGEMAAIIEREGCGVVVPPEDPARLADAVRRLADSDEDARAMGERGQTWALRDYDFRGLVRRWWDAVSEGLPRPVRDSGTRAS